MIRKRKAYLPGLPMSGPQVALPPLLRKQVTNNAFFETIMITDASRVVVIPDAWKTIMVVAIGGGGGFINSNSYGGGGAYAWAKIIPINRIFQCSAGIGGGSSQSGGTSSVSSGGLVIIANGGDPGDAGLPGAGGTFSVSPNSQTIDFGGGRGGDGGGAGGPYGNGRDRTSDASTGGGAGIFLSINGLEGGGGSVPQAIPEKVRNVEVANGNGPGANTIFVNAPNGNIETTGLFGGGGALVSSNPVSGAPGCVAFIRLD